MANFYKNFEVYDQAINYYSKIIKTIKNDSLLKSDLLFRRGGSHERKGDYAKADKDLLEALRINPDDAYVLNYLAYSWLERDHNINEAIKMLERAYTLKKNDPYIIDSIGWAYFMVEDYLKAEKYLSKAIELSLTGNVFPDYFETDNFPVDTYLEFKKVTTQAKDDCCTPRSMTVYLAEEANVSLILRDPLKNPDFEWGETFCTMLNNTIRIYRNSNFNIVNPVLTYYEKPRLIQMVGAVNPYTGAVSAVNVNSEFKDDLVEVMLDDTASIIAGDIENSYQQQRGTQAAERNN
mgnify:CR=1 FL=1